MSPAAGSLGGGTDLTITGDFFDTPVQVTVAGNNVEISLHGSGNVNVSGGLPQHVFISFEACGRYVRAGDPLRSLDWHFALKRYASHSCFSFHPPGSPCQIKHVIPRKIVCTTGDVGVHRRLNGPKPGALLLWHVQVVASLTIGLMFQH